VKKVASGRGGAEMANTNPASWRLSGVRFPTVYLVFPPVPPVEFRCGNALEGF